MHKRLETVVDSAQQQLQKLDVPAIGEGVAGGPGVPQLLPRLPIAGTHALIHHAAIVPCAHACWLSMLHMTRLLSLVENWTAQALFAAMSA